MFALDGTVRSSLWVVPRIQPDASAARRLLGGVGSFEQVGWSPAGRWVVAAWPAAEQWVFLRADGGAILIGVGVYLAGDYVVGHTCQMRDWPFNVVRKVYYGLQGKRLCRYRYRH